MLPPDYRFSRAHDLAEGLSNLVAGRLFIEDENVSRVQLFFESDRTPAGANDHTGERVEAIWLVHATGISAPVGMAVVSRERASGVFYHQLNVFVVQEHAGQGVGATLINAATASFPTLYGHYNPDTIALYSRAGVRDVIQMERDPSGTDSEVELYVQLRQAKIYQRRAVSVNCIDDGPHHGRFPFTTSAAPSIPHSVVTRTPSRRPRFG